MKTYTYEGKNLEEVKEKALKELKKTEEEVLQKIEEEEVGLFKTKKIKVELLIKEDVLKCLKEKLLEIVEQMGVKANVEAKIRENNFKLSLFSDNNAILIGKGGRTIESLQTLLKAIISNKTHFNVSVAVDVEDYKEKQGKRIESIARRVANEVLSTGMEVKLDSMNSYERRLVHETISKIEGLSTISEGEEPNRYVVIKKI